MTTENQKKYPASNSQEYDLLSLELTTLVDTLIEKKGWTGITEFNNYLDKYRIKYKTDENSNNILDKKGNPKKEILCDGSSILKQIRGGYYHVDKPIPRVIKTCKRFLKFLKSEDFFKLEESESKKHFYHLYYWRIDGKGRDCLGLAKLEIYNNRKKARLKYFYHTYKNRSALLNEGEVWTHGNNAIYISLKDTFTNNRTADTFLILHTLAENQTDYLVGIISTSNRLQKFPTSSVCILVKCDSHEETIDTSKHLSGFDTQEPNGKRGIIFDGINKVDESIIYYLAGNQIKVENDVGVLTNLNQLSTYADFEKLSKFNGTYQTIFAQTNYNPKKLNAYIIEIKKSGVAKINKDDNTSEIGRVKVMNKDSTPILLIQFDYDSKKRVYNFSMVLKEMEKGYLTGVYIGMIDNTMASGRVLLKIVSGDYKPISVPLKNKNVIEEISKITDNDKYVIDFFIDDDFADFTDLGLSHLIYENKTPIPDINDEYLTTVNNQNVFEEMYGDYDCFFNMKKIEKNSSNNDSSTFGQILYQLPLKFNKDEISIKYQSEIIDGYTIFDSKKMMLIFEGKDYYITILIRPTEKPSIIYGIISIINDDNFKNKDSIQSCYLIIEKSKDGFIKSNFKFYDTLTGLISVEKQRMGLVTKVFGHYNRAILTRESNDNDFNHIRWQSYRRTFWNSACFNAQRYKETGEAHFLKDAYDDLVRSYHHGFGMKYWSNKTIGDKGFPKELNEEYEMMVEEYNTQKYFSDVNCRAFLLKRISYFYNEKTKG